MNSHNMYADLAPFYDLLNSEVDFEKWAEYIEKQCLIHCRKPIKEMLDLGCGTGKMTILMAQKGFDMVGLDNCEEMLSEAMNCAYETPDLPHILWTCQDMTNFELYGTVDATISCLDCLNHLPDKTALKKCFDLVHNYLVPDGLFFFDVNTPYKFVHIYGQNDYILEDEDLLLAWQNDYDEHSATCRFSISIFSKDEDGRYERLDSEQIETCFSFDDIQSIAKEAGFSFCAVHGSVNADEIEQTTERWHFIFRAIK